MADTNMTDSEVRLADEKMRAEIAKMLAKTKQIGVTPSSRHSWLRRR